MEMWRIRELWSPSARPERNQIFSPPSPQCWWQRSHSPAWKSGLEQRASTWWVPLHGDELGPCRPSHLVFGHAGWRCSTASSTGLLSWWTACAQSSHTTLVTSSIRTWHGRTQRTGGQRFSMNTSRFGYFFCWQGHCSTGFTLLNSCKEPKDKGYSIEFLRTTFQQPAWELCEEEIPHQVNLFSGS